MTKSIKYACANTQKNPYTRRKGKTILHINVYTNLTRSVCLLKTSEKHNFIAFCLFLFYVTSWSKSLKLNRLEMVFWCKIYISLEWKKHKKKVFYKTKIEAIDLVISRTFVCDKKRKRGEKTSIQKQFAAFINEIDSSMKHVYWSISISQPAKESKKEL